MIKEGRVPTEVNDEGMSPEGQRKRSHPMNTRQRDPMQPFGKLRKGALGPVEDEET